MSVTLSSKSSNLETVEIRSLGEWPDTDVNCVREVAISVRAASLQHAGLPADGPSRIDVEWQPHMQYPQVHSASRPDNSARILLATKGTAWVQMAYQFGHELGHLVANSWADDGIPQTPSHWIEEVMVEAFSISTLLRLENEWRNSPPSVTGARDFAPHFTTYAIDRLTLYSAGEGAALFQSDPVAWYQKNRSVLESAKTLVEDATPIVPTIVPHFSSRAGTVKDLAAMNRWPDRSGRLLDNYLSEWQGACDAIGAPGILPRMIKNLLFTSENLVR